MIRTSPARIGGPTVVVALLVAGVAPESLLGKTICVSGTITEYKGKAEIKVSDPLQIRIVD